MLIDDGEMYNLMERLFPICRSITGNGVRETLKIINDLIPLDMHEVPSGTKVFDWEIPDEWNIKDAYVKNSDEIRVIDFKESNLHIVNYSIPYEGKIKLDEIKDHLHTLPDQPELTPYVTSYYKKDWGFCLPHNDYLKLDDDIYSVKIDSSLKPGHLTYAELIIPGESDDEIFISTNICHPSMANNELSGPVVATFLARELLNRKLRYTYRFVFVPETIGSIAYLSKNLDHMKKKVVAGYVITCVGDPGNFSYLSTKEENALTDRVTFHVLKNSDEKYIIFNFLERGSDERQYNSPGIDLPVGSLMRTQYRSYPEYHTSGDNLDFVTPEALDGSLDMYLRCIEALENNRTYKTKILGEPQLGKRGLYPNLSIKGSVEPVRKMKNLLAYCDGEHDLVCIADKIDCPVWDLVPITEKLLSHEILEIAN